MKLVVQENCEVALLDKTYKGGDLITVEDDTVNTDIIHAMIEAGSVKLEAQHKKDVAAAAKAAKIAKQSEEEGDHE